MKKKKGIKAQGRKKISDYHNWGAVYKITDQYFSKSPVLRKTWKKLRNSHRFEETMESWQLNTVWDPGLDPRTEKTHQWKNW